jgi:chemotaxis protein MotB
MSPRALRHTVEEEESYFVSMTDLMVGLLFIFIIMLMVFALQYREGEKEP